MSALRPARARKGPATPEDTPANRADQAVDLASTDPGRARAEALAVLADPGAVPAERSTAHRALGLATRELGDLTGARDHLITAITVAEGAGLTVHAARAKSSLVTVEGERGDLAGALSLADDARPHLSGEDLARLSVQRGVILARLGRPREAVRLFDDALTALTGDTRYRTGTLLNRGLTLAYLGDLDRAERDLRTCAELAHGSGHRHLAALARSNLAFISVRRDDLPAAFAHTAAAEPLLSAYPERLAGMWVDLAEALLAAHLPGEARVTLGRALPVLEDTGSLAGLAEARLLLARAELLAGEPRRALATAGTARREFEAQRRTGWTPLADDVAVHARLAVDGADGTLLADARRLAAHLAEAGWPTESAQTHLTAARIALLLGEDRTARIELDAVLAARGDGLTAITARRHAQALQRLSAGNRRGAFAALRAGLRAVAARTSGFGAPDLRAHAVHRGRELADLGVALALRTGRAVTVLAWEELRRGVVTGPATRPAGRRGLAALRRTDSELRARGGGGDTARLRAERARLEEAVRREHRRLTAVGGSAAATPDPALLRAAVGEAALLEFVRDGGRLSVVVITARRCVLRTLCDYPEVAGRIARLRYGLRRLVLRDASARAVAAAEQGVAAEAAALDRLLFGPISTVIGDRALVVVPVGPLAALPWTVLPRLAGRHICVAPSAARWLTAATRPPGAGPVIAVAGPGLRFASREAAMVRRLHPGTRIVRAASAPVLRALDGASLAHLATHGEFRADSPLFSGLSLRDGPLFAYDLLRLRRAPALTILSSCDAGLAVSPVEGAPLGLVGSFLDLGGSCVVAGVVPVDDERTHAFMEVFHGLLATGRPAAEALATASVTTEVAGFVCFGAGDQRVATGRDGSSIQFDQDPT
ncbi:CHAT domain-containing protein [Rhizohabitans arisaemae]|uniref:CHAT domain-containing protein n=1 Tax=Rhizohabitans arisaemae TaxID=2720610 RepID=UPI0024B06131|nr:CHAT domain-containing tetratricopeptide repeat protein [Rhizohabitans arisaemae]